MSIGIQSLKLCFGTCCTLIPGLDSAEYELQYQNSYKPLISALYNLPGLPFTIYMSGTLIDWMEHNHAEFFMILEEMVSRKQIDILGGGFFSPLFPLLPPADRVGQIELLTTTLRKYFGKRPRGVWLPSSAWEPSMVSSLNTCGIEYILLDKIMLETSGFPGVDGCMPVTLEDCGKTITALPLDNRYRYLERFSPESFLRELGSPSDSNNERVAVVFIDQSSIAPLFNVDSDNQTWFHSFIDLLPKTEGFSVELTTTGRVLKSRNLYKRAYISSGMSPFDLDDPHAPDDVMQLARTSVKQYLVRSGNIMNLYAKMIYVHTLVNQLRGDKARKKNAREELWRAQTGEIYRTTEVLDTANNRALRVLAYKNLLVAEKSSRLRGVFSPSVITFDFDMDGLKEYLCQLDSLNMYVHSCGGKLFELDVFGVYRNYCDLCIPSYGMFIDHFVGPEEIAQLQNGTIPASHTVFSETMYQDVSIDSSRHELQLRTSGLYGSFQQPVSLRKQYSFRNEGIQVQYILKNDSPLNLSGIFMIELDIAISRSRQQPPFMTVYAHDKRQDSAINEGHYEDVSWVQLSDSDAEARFTIDANENPSVSVLPVFCLSGDRTPDQVNPEGVRIFLYWKVDLGPNYEMEKMIFLKIDT